MVSYKIFDKIVINQMRICINASRKRIDNENLINQLNEIINEIENPIIKENNWNYTIYYSFNNNNNNNKYINIGKK